MEKHYTLAEAAKLLRISAPTLIERIIKNGVAIPTAGMGKKKYCLVPHSVLQEINFCHACNRPLDLNDLNGGKK